MNAATLSIFIRGIYVMLMGLLLVFIPGKTLFLFGLINLECKFVHVYFIH